MVIRLFDPAIFDGPDSDLFDVYIFIPKTPKYPPRIVRIDKKYSIELMKLGIIKPLIKDFLMKQLSVNKLNRINILLTDLNITIPKSIDMFLKDLILMEKEGKSVPIEKLRLIKEVEIETLTNKLNVLSSNKSVLTLSELGIISKIKEIVEANVPNIHALKMKELTKYLELIDLLNELED